MAPDDVTSVYAIGQLADNHLPEIDPEPITETPAPINEPERAPMPVVTPTAPSGPNPLLMVAVLAGGMLLAGLIVALLAVILIFIG